MGGGGGSFEPAFEQQNTIDEINNLKKEKQNKQKQTKTNKQTKQKTSVFKETPDVN